MNRKTSFHPLYILPILYVLAAYTFPTFLVLVMLDVSWTRNLQFDISFYVGALLLLLLLNLVPPLLAARRTDGIVYLKCAGIIKYGLVPFYLVFGTLLAMMMIIPANPALIMGPVCGWLIVAFASPYFIIYMVKACRQGRVPGLVGIFACVLQFFFTVDVITVMVCALREKVFRKWTVLTVLFAVLFAMLVIGLLAAGAALGIGTLIFEELQEKFTL